MIEKLNPVLAYDRKTEFSPSQDVHLLGGSAPFSSASLFEESVC